MTATSRRSTTAQSEGALESAKARMMADGDKAPRIPYQHPSASFVMLPAAAAAATAAEGGHDARGTDPTRRTASSIARRALLDTQGRLVAEDDEGSVEYKWRLTNINPSRFEHLKTQMQFRVAEGHGQCLYEIGVADDGNPRGLNPDDYDESIDTVRRMAESLGFEMRVVHERVVAEAPTVLSCAELMVTKQLSVCDQMDLRVAFCGDSESGKSTLVSVLVHGALDDGTGVVRQGMFNHKHEVTSGRTSSVSHRVLGFDETGRVTNYDAAPDGGSTAPRGVADVYGGANLCAAENTTRTIAERSVKLVTLMDLGGDRRYSKTALLGMTSRMPGYACICASVDRVLDGVAQYMTLCAAMRIPFFVVLTKSDAVSELEVDDALFDLHDLLEKQFDMRTLRVEGEDDVQLALAALIAPSPSSTPEKGSAASLGTSPVTTSPAPARQQMLVPVFLASSVEGTGIAELKQLFHRLPAPANNSMAVQQQQAACSPVGGGGVEVLLDGTLQVPKVGTVLCGFITRGTIRLNDTLKLGPDRKGVFHPVTVDGIHVKGSHVTYATSGLEVTIAIRQHLPMLNLQRKGNVLVDVLAKPNVCVEFWLDVQVLTKGDTITVNQEPIVHTRNIRQAARIVACHPETLVYGGGDVQPYGGRIRCKFLYSAEVLDVGATVLLRWNQHAKMMGVVVETCPMTPTTSPAMRPEAPPSSLMDHTSSH